MKPTKKLAMSQRKPEKPLRTKRNSPLYDLVAPDIVEHIKIVQNANRATDWHFRVNSKFAKALEEHLRTASDAKCIVDREGRALSCHRGTGYAVELRRVCVHFAMPGEVEHMSFDVCVGWEPLESDHEYDSQGGRDVEREYHLYCPTDLELNFNKAKFDLWIKSTKERLDAERLKKERKELDRLLKRHPSYATTKLLKTKPSDS
jgi:hypothetical protein